MMDTLLHRLWSPGDALSHPVSLWIVIAVAAVLLLCPVLFIALRGAGAVDSNLNAELRRRWLSWLVIAPLMIGPILIGPLATMLAVCILSLACYREFARATGLFRETRVSLVVVLGILGVAFASADHWYGLFVAAFPLTAILISAVSLVEDRPRGYIQRVGLTIFGFMFFGACLGQLSFFTNDAAYRPVLLMILLTVELNDVFAFTVGKTLGRGGRKLCPNTSPNKTVAGSLGSLALTTPLVAFLAHHIFKGTTIDTPVHLITLGLLVAVGGQLGDLMLSAVKRDIGLKDLGHAIPGHGGFLDRFDSLILVAPAVFHFVAYFRGVGLDQPVRIFTGGGSP